MRKFLTSSLSEILLWQWQQAKLFLARKLTTIAAIRLQTDNDKKINSALSGFLHSNLTAKVLSYLTSKPLCFSIRPNKYPTGFSRLFISRVNQYQMFALFSWTNRQFWVVLFGRKDFNSLHRFLKQRIEIFLSLQKLIARNDRRNWFMENH